MARKYSTLRTDFVQRKSVAETNFFKSSPSDEPVKHRIPAKPHGHKHGQQAAVFMPDRGLSGAQTLPELSTLLNDTLPATMETLRSHVNYLLRLPLPVAEKNRLLLKYWAMECRLEAVRLLLDEAVECGVGLGEDAIDLACFDLSGFSPADFYFTGSDWAELL